MMKSSRLNSSFHQRGIVSVMAAIILIVAVIYVLNQSYGIIGTNSNANQSQGDSTAAFFLAESGLERAQSILKNAPNPSAKSACTGITESNFTLGSGKFNLSATPTGCDGSNLNCTSCEITSTGLVVGSASRTLSLIMSLSAPSGGAKGCGGGGTTPPLTACAALSPAVPPANQSQYIDQNIAVTATNSPAILLSNVAYARHPQGNSNSVETSSCVAAIGSTSSTSCISQWNDQSASNNGSNVVGSQGASVGPLTNLGTYTLRQSLTQDSLFAAVGMIASGANIDLVGSSVTNSSASYWDDVTSGNTSATVSGNGSGSGQTNDGSWCNFSSGSCTSATTINGATFSKKQTSNSWCYDGDTLVFGLSGSSNNNATGALTSFTFGTSPESTAVPNGIAIYPSTHTNNTQVFSSLRYLYNPYYRSTMPSGSPGATSYPSAVMGSIGATFTGKLTNNAKTLSVTGLTGSLCFGDSIAGGNGLGASPTLTIDGTNITSNVSASAGYCASTNGNYTLSVNSTNSTNTTRTATSYQFIVTGTTGANLSAGVTSNTNVTISSGPVLSRYTLALQKQLGTITVTQGTQSNPNIINVPPGGVIPIAGTYVTVFSGTGKIPTLTTITGTPTATQFTLSSAPSITLSSAVICGGICAYFNHGAAATTNFTVGVSNTSQWAAGMTCLKGVDTSTIQGLTGTSAGAQATTWHEVVN